MGIFRAVSIIRQQHHPRLFAVVLAVVAAALVGWQALLIGDFRIDDAYISFSFSKNLAQGRGLTFGYGALRVEGYTNFLWTVINAVPMALGAVEEPYIAARVMAFACLAVTLWATYRTTRLFAGPLASAASVVVLAAWTDLTRAALSGLETVPHAMCLALGTLQYAKDLGGEQRRPPIWFALGALIRISAMQTLGFVVAFDVAVRFLRREFDFKSWVRWAAPAIAPFVAYFAWRYWYYGLPLPTTYYAKTFTSLLDPDRGFRYVWDGFRGLGAVPVIAFAAIALSRAFDRRLGFLAGAIALELSYVMRVGGDWMPFNRFLIAVAPQAVTLFAAGASVLWRSFSPGPLVPRLAAAGAVLSSYAWVLVHVDSHTVNTPQEYAMLGEAEHTRFHTRENLLANRRFFQSILRKPGEVLVTDYGGVLGYYTDASLIEMWGLCNVDIALHGNANGINPIYGKTCVECYRKFDPDYFHLKVPIVRGENDLTFHSAVIDEVFQGRELDRVLSLERRYATGRVRHVVSGTALFFLEKRRRQYPLEPRVMGNGMVVDYPFEPGGAWMRPGGLPGNEPSASHGR